VRILITGVTGYIGRALCASLIAAGHEVVATSRDPARARAALPALADAFRWSPMHEPLPSDAVAGVEAVVHLAGEAVSPPWTASKKQRIFDTRVQGTWNLVRGLEAAAERPRVLISASAVGYYGHRGDDELTEAEPAGSDFLAGVCSGWEEEAMAASTLGIRMVRMRTGLVVGSGSPFLKPLVPLFKLGMGGKLGSGRQWWPWVHVSDVTGLVGYAIAEPCVSGALNATSPNPARQRDFAKALGRQLHRPAIAPAPAFAIRLVLGDFAAELLNSKRVLPKAALDRGYRFAYAELDGALQEALGTH
jgi:uncharacterized protein (TIGR01777 family)